MVLQIIRLSPEDRSIPPCTPQRNPPVPHHRDKSFHNWIRTVGKLYRRYTEVL